MIELTYIAVFLAALFGGVITGLLPGLPAWLAPFILTPFISHLGINEVIVFWILTVMGSQFFGSIASIMFGIPGENSSLAYINDIRSFSLQERIKLISMTANASFISSIFVLVLLYFSHGFLIDLMPFFGTTIFKFCALWFISVVVCLLTDKKWLSVILFTLGAVLAPKSNIALPAIFAHMNQYTYDISLITVVLGLMVIPEIFNRVGQFESNINRFSSIRQTKPTIIGTITGIIFGFLPGPTATMSATMAYKKTPGNIVEKIISAEAANNSVILIGAFLLLYLQIPLSIDAVTVFTIVSSQGWDIQTDFIQVVNMEIFFGTLILGATIIWGLARKSNKFYAWVCRNLNNNVWFIIVATVGLLTMDLILGEGSYQLLNYLTWLIIVISIGVTLRALGRSPLPLILGYIFGDQLVWSTYQILF